MEPKYLVSLPTAVIDDIIYIERPYVANFPRMRQLVPLHVYHKQKSKKIQKIKALSILNCKNAKKPKKCQKIVPTLRGQQHICSLNFDCQTSEFADTRAPGNFSPTFGGLNQQRQTANFGHADFVKIVKDSGRSLNTAATEQDGQPIFYQEFIKPTRRDC